MIEHLQKLPPETVERFLATRDAEALEIPEKLADYILQINEASNLSKKYHSITECAIKLHESFPQLSVHTCKSRIYDAINYLNDNCSVTSDAWLLYYADMFMKLFEVCLVAHNYQEAGRCLQKSCEYRIKATANAIDPQRIKFKPQIVSPDIVLERMFIKEKGVLTSFKQALSFMETVDINDVEKQRIINEAKQELNITDVEHEEIG